MTGERQGMQRLRANSAAAHILPLAAFLVLLLPLDAIRVDHPLQPWYVRAPEHWVYPLQTALCGAMLWWFRGSYRFRPVRGLGMAAGLAVLTIAVWVAPAAVHEEVFGPDGETPRALRWLGVVPRTDGFDPHEFGDSPALFAMVIALRFARMAVVVPFIEEIFWRGFLMRYLVDPGRRFETIPFGAFDWKAVVITTVLFMFVHAPADWFGALVFGAAMAWLAIRTKSLAACIVMHAAANILLGLYVLATRQWGFW